MKRILIFSLAYLPRHIGGAEVAIKEITGRIPTEEIEFHMITNRYDSSLPVTEKVGNVMVHRIGVATGIKDMSDLRKFPLHLNKPLYQFLAFLKAIQLHRKYHFDGIWAMMAHATGVPSALFNIVHPRVPYILTLQEGDPPRDIERTMRPLWPLFSRAFKKADVVQVISSFLGGWARERGARVIKIIPNGVDVARFSRGVDEAARVYERQNMGISPAKTLLITTSRLVKKNGVDIVIDALATVPKDVHLAVAGDGPERALLESQTVSLGLQNQVHFLGEVSQETLPRLLASSDIFIRASRSEGQGIAFIEAMAAGLPTIGTRVGGIPDVIEDGVTGYLAEPTIASVTETIARVIAKPAEARDIAERGQARVRERYEWDAIVEELRTKVFSVVTNP